jgi:hypothetical protein
MLKYEGVEDRCQIAVIATPCCFHSGSYTVALQLCYEITQHLCKCAVNYIKHSSGPCSATLMVSSSNKSLKVHFKLNAILMPPSTCLLPLVMISEFPHWSASEITFLLYIRTSHCLLHLPCHILHSVDLCFSALLASSSDDVEMLQ